MNETTTNTEAPEITATPSVDRAENAINQEYLNDIAEDRQEEFTESIEEYGEERKAEQEEIIEHARDEVDEAYAAER